MSNYKGRSTQNIVNTFPLWSNIRLDEQSAGQQFLNPIGLQLDDLRRQLSTIGNNYFLPTANVKDIDVYYYYNLPKDYIFNEDTDDTELLFTPPTVSGLVDNTFYNLTLATDNEVENFWYNAIPTRISYSENIASGEHLVASGYAFQSPLRPLPINGTCHIANQLYVTISGGTSYLDLNDFNVPSRCLVQIDGITRAGVYTTEELVFIHDDTLTTMREFASVSGIRIYGVDDPTEAFIQVTSAQFQVPYERDAYSLDFTLDNQPMPTFWSLTSGSNFHTLNFNKYDIDDIEARLDGFVTRSPIAEYKLVDTSGYSYTAYDFAVEPFSTNVWTVGSGILYLHDNYLELPPLNTLLEKDYDSNSVMECSKYTIYPGEELQIDYIWKRPTKGIKAHRVWVEVPNGTKYSVVDGSFTTYVTDSGSWEYGEPHGRKIRPTDIFTNLTTIGTYTFSMEVSYADDTTAIDQRCILVATKTARGSYNLTEAGIVQPIVGIDFDSEGKMWVMDTSGVKYQVDLHYDNMIIDIEKKVIYFRDNYDQIRVY